MAGSLGTFGDKPFVSGSCMVLSRDVVKDLVEHIQRSVDDLPNIHYDDVIISRMIMDHIGVQPISMMKEDWMDGVVSDLSKDSWAYRLSVPYGSQQRISKFRAVEEYLNNQE
jgi:DNA-directed RNA polymerase subunit H (RpoH/RPB5)